MPSRWMNYENTATYSRVKEKKTKKNSELGMEWTIMCRSLDDTDDTCTSVVTTFTPAQSAPVFMIMIKLYVVFITVHKDNAYKMKQVWEAV